MSNTEEHKYTIAIDGPSSTGKSTLAKKLANALSYTYVDTGAMYRAVTLYALENGIDVNDSEAVAAILDDITLSFSGAGTKSLVMLNGEIVEKRIRTLEVSNAVSEIATIPEVRRKLVAQQQRLGAQGGIVMDGRDIGTVVFPDADLKFFLKADEDTRLTRRYEELSERDESISLKQVLDNLRHRDHIDSTREDSPLRQADDAIVIDNSFLSIDEQLSYILEIIYQLKSIDSLSQA